MPIVPIALTGQYGISLDVSPAELPPNAWSAGYNIRFHDGTAKTMYGDKVLFPTPKQPFWCLPVQGSSADFAGWVLALEDSIYALKGTTLTDITPAAPPPRSSHHSVIPLEDNPWSGGNLGLVTIVNDSYRTPWVWMAPDTTIKMVPMADWPAGMLCYTLRSFKQVLVALAVEKPGSAFFPQMVKWSHPADPGSLPPTWDETDATKDAGETVLAETPGMCIDAVGLRDALVIYKTDSVWSMQYIGGVFVYRFTKLFGEWGIPRRDCAVEFTAGQHFCFTGTDLMIHDGNSAVSIIKGRMKRLLRTIDREQLKTCFVCSNPAWSEVWFCWKRAADGKLAADTAIVYNHADKTMSLRILPDLRFAAVGRVDLSTLQVDTWDATVPVWDAAGVVWSEFQQIPAHLRLLGLGEMNVQWIDGAQEFHSPVLLERTYVGIPTRADKPPDLSAMKFIRRVWPRFTGRVNTEITVTFGSADSVAEPIKWRAPLTFVIGVTRKFDITLSGKVMALRIEASSPMAVTGEPVLNWRFDGLDIDVKPAGEM